MCFYCTLATQKKFALLSNHYWLLDSTITMHHRMQLVVVFWRVELFVLVHLNLERWSLEALHPWISNFGPHLVLHYSRYLLGDET